MVFSVKGLNLAKVAEANVGKSSQDAIWSRDGKAPPARNRVENALCVLKFDGNRSPRLLPGRTKKMK